MEVMSTQLNGISESVTSQIKDLEKKFENTVQNQMSALATATEKTFANAVKETNIHDSQKSLREIIKEARTE